MQRAYRQLFELGIAHSVEVWIDRQLAGGLYGLAIGRMFYGESMFSHVTDASKIGLAYLVAFLKSQQVAMIDCQQETGHLASLGANPISRAAFISHMNSAIGQPPIAAWQPVALFDQLT
jgi:leucyl/phenylalanyl-tRNA--protein transferase